MKAAVTSVVIHHYSLHHFVRLGPKSVSDMNSKQFTKLVNFEIFIMFCGSVNICTFL